MGLCACWCVFVSGNSHFQMLWWCTDTLQANAGGLWDTWDIQKSPQNTKMTEKSFFLPFHHARVTDTMRAAFVFRHQQLRGFTEWCVLGSKFTFRGFRFHFSQTRPGSNGWKGFLTFMSFGWFRGWHLKHQFKSDMLSVPENYIKLILKYSSVHCMCGKGTIFPYHEDEV